MTDDCVKANINGEEVTIRPLHAADTGMEAQFVRALSVEARRYRFFGSVKELSAAELKLLCDVDGVGSMAFVATIQSKGHESAIGVSRYARSQTEGVREMALTIADGWQQSGVAELLMTQLIDFARAHGVRQLYSVELAENRAMRALAQKYAMTAERDLDDAAQVVYSLRL